MNRLTLKKGRVGASVLTGYEKVSALVGAWGTFSGTAQLKENEAVTLYSLDDLKVYGIQSDKSPLLYHHVSEYFRIAPAGATLWLLSVPSPDNTFSGIINAEAVKKMIARAGGDIFNLAFSFVPDAAVEIVDGMPNGLYPAIRDAQAFADWATETNRPLHILLEGAGYKGPASSTLNLRQLGDVSTPTEAPQVSVIMGQDWAFADTLSGQDQKYAAVGTALGCMARQPVNFNIGEVETMSLTDAIRGVWVEAGLSNHLKIRDQETDLTTLNLKGFVFGEYYGGNVVLNDDHNCTPEIVDAQGNMNECSIALSRTNAKVIRELYKAYLPKLKSTYPVEADGSLSTGMVKYFEGIGDGVFARMEKSVELSTGATLVDKTSNLLYGDKTLKISYNWIPTGTVRYIEGVINIKTSM